MGDVSDDAVEWVEIAGHYVATVEGLHCCVSHQRPRGGWWGRVVLGPRRELHAVGCDTAHEAQRQCERLARAEAAERERDALREAREHEGLRDS